MLNKNCHVLQAAPGWSERVCTTPPSPPNKTRRNGPWPGPPAACTARGLCCSPGGLGDGSWELVAVWSVRCGSALLVNGSVNSVTCGALSASVLDRVSDAGGDFRRSSASSGDGAACPARVPPPLPVLTLFRQCGYAMLAEISFPSPSNPVRDAGWCE